MYVLTQMLRCFRLTFLTYYLLFKSHLVIHTNRMKNVRDDRIKKVVEFFWTNNERKGYKQACGKSIM